MDNQKFRPPLSILVPGPGAGASGKGRTCRQEATQEGVLHLHGEGDVRAPRVPEEGDAELLRGH